MKYYLAARYSRKLELQTYASDLKLQAHPVTSSWLDEGVEDSSLANVREFPIKHPRMAQLAINDLREIDAADTFILFSDPMFPGQPRGSKHVEFGYALAQGLRCVVIGPLENLFHHLNCVQVFADWEEFLGEEFHDDF